MKKPKKHKREYYDYHECAEYIAHKLGVKDLRNFANWSPGQKDQDNPPYQDFWHFVLDGQDQFCNGCFIYLPFLDDNSDYGDWQIKILKEFNKEFGDETQYWVAW